MNQSLKNLIVVPHKYLISSASMNSLQKHVKNMLTRLILLFQNSKLALAFLKFKNI